MERMCIGLLHLDFPIHLSNFRAKNTPKVGLLRPKTMHKYFLNNSKTSLKISKIRLSKLKKARNDPSKIGQKSKFWSKISIFMLIYQPFELKIYFNFFYGKGPHWSPWGPTTFTSFSWGREGPWSPTPFTGGPWLFFLGRHPSEGPEKGCIPYAHSMTLTLGAPEGPCTLRNCRGALGPKDLGTYSGARGALPPLQIPLKKVENYTQKWAF